MAVRRRVVACDRNTDARRFPDKSHNHTRRLVRLAFQAFADQVGNLKQRFALDHVVLVGGRGMMTQACIDEDLRPAGLDWITALRAPALRGLVGGGYLQMSLFDERDMAAITSPDFPGERLIVCRNADLAHERARRREDLLAASGRDLAKIVSATSRF